VPLGDKYERRSLISTLLVGESIALAFAASAANVIGLSLACFCVGALTATVHVIVPLSAHLAPPKERVESSGRFSAACSSASCLRELSAESSARNMAGGRLLVRLRVDACVGRYDPHVLAEESARALDEMAELMRSIWSLAREHACCVKLRCSRVSFFYRSARCGRRWYFC
jgi:hypothetical protein